MLPYCNTPSSSQVADSAGRLNVIDPTGNVLYEYDTGELPRRGSRLLAAKKSYLWVQTMCGLFVIMLSLPPLLFCCSPSSRIGSRSPVTALASYSLKRNESTIVTGHKDGEVG